MTSHIIFNACVLILCIGSARYIRNKADLRTAHNTLMLLIGAIGLLLINNVFHILTR